MFNYSISTKNIKLKMFSKKLMLPTDTQKNTESLKYLLRYQPVFFAMSSPQWIMT